MKTWNFFVSEYMVFWKGFGDLQSLIWFVQFFELVMQCEKGLGKIPKVIINFLSVHQVEF